MEAPPSVLTPRFGHVGEADRFLDPPLRAMDVPRLGNFHFEVSWTWLGSLKFNLLLAPRSPVLIVALTR